MKGVDEIEWKSVDLPDYGGKRLGIREVRVRVMPQDTIEIEHSSLVPIYLSSIFLSITPR